MTMLDRIRQRIDEEMARLEHELKWELPERIRKAVELGDLRENADYKSALERQQFVQARIGHLAQRQAELSKIDVKSLPEDRADFGSRLKVLDLELGEEMSLTITAGEFVDFEKGEISLASPLGRGFRGARQGEEVTVQLPRGPRRFRILELATLPQQLGLNDQAD